MEVLLSAPASLVFGVAVVIAWHLRRQQKNWPRRRADYVWAFIDGSIIYVMAMLLFVHYSQSLSYSQILDHGFGEIQVSIAFIGALYEGVWALWDLWNGHSLLPPAGGSGLQP
jgi:hypothetical protein